MLLFSCVPIANLELSRLDLCKLLNFSCFMLRDFLNMKVHRPKFRTRLSMIEYNIVFSFAFLVVDKPGQDPWAQIVCVFGYLHKLIRLVDM